GGNLTSKDAIEKSFKSIRDAGFTTIYWRMLWEGHPMDDMLFFSHRTQAEIFQAKKDVENTPYRWDPHELRWPIEVAHRLGMKLYAWVVPYNDGAPPGATAQYGVTPTPYKFAYGPVYETQPSSSGGADPPTSVGSSLPTRLRSGQTPSAPRRR
ncbi:MAG: hypothetical protein DMG07_00620, partial [Acidobacteria bacterium]